MFHPSMVCSIRPFQQSSLICSRKNSAMPLFHPAQQDGGVGAFEEDGLVGGEQGDAAGGEFFFQFQRVEGVPGGAVDVLADHGGECRGRAARLGEQVGHAPVAGDADAVDGDRLLLVRKTYGNQWDIPAATSMSANPLPRPANESCAKNSAPTGSPSGSRSWSGRPSTRRR